MKNLLKLTIIVLMISMTSNSFAQKWGIKAGLNLSSMTIKDNAGNVYSSTELQPGFHVGVTADFPLADEFSFETGLMVSTKGIKVDDSGDTYSINSTYLEVPLNFKSTRTFGTTKVYGTFGPYLGYGIAGKSKYTTNSVTTSSDIKWGSNSDSDLKPLDFGLSIGLGVEFSKMSLGVSYGLGLTNMAPSNTNDLQLKNKVIGISVGFKF